MHVIIGVDPHKAWHTAVAIDTNEDQLGHKKVRATRTQVDQLLAWADPFRARTWAIEGVDGMGYLLAQQLVATGEHVINVPATLAARTRLLGTGRTNKNDPNDALSVAVTALRTNGLRQVRPVGHSEVLRLLAKHLPAPPIPLRRPRLLRPSRRRGQDQQGSPARAQAPDQQHRLPTPRRRCRPLPRLTGPGGQTGTTPSQRDRSYIPDDRIFGEVTPGPSANARTTAPRRLLDALIGVPKDPLVPERIRRRTGQALPQTALDQVKAPQQVGIGEGALSARRLDLLHNLTNGYGLTPSRRCDLVGSAGHHAYTPEAMTTRRPAARYRTPPLRRRRCGARQLDQGGGLTTTPGVMDVQAAP